MALIQTISAILTELMVGASLRALALGALVTVVLFAIRANTQLRHAAWTGVLVSMLILPIASFVLPPLPLPAAAANRLKPVLSAPTPARVYNAHPIRLDFATRTVEQPAATTSSAPVAWTTYATAIYLLFAFAFLSRVLIGICLTRRLLTGTTTLRDSEANDVLDRVADRQNAPYPLPILLESKEVTVPCVVALDQPAILLPVEWRTWDEWKLQAVLAHELTHARRGDWHFLLLASINKCVFWFHPLAWWLERRVAALSEQASDEASLLVTRDPARYAGVLLEVAASVPPAHGRLIPAAVPMASTHPVARRINRILDRPIGSTGVLPTRSWLMLATCMIPLVGAIAAAQVAQPPYMVFPPVPAGPSLQQGRQYNSEQARQFEQAVANNPQDLEARGALIAYYYANAKAEELTPHVIWVIEHHPDSDLASLPLVNQPYFAAKDLHVERKKTLWLQQAAVYNNNPRVLANAAAFVARLDPPESERLLKRAISLDTNNPQWLQNLADLYAQTIYAGFFLHSGVNVMSDWVGANVSYPQQLKDEMERSNDLKFIGNVASRLAATVAHTQLYISDKQWMIDQARNAARDYTRSLLKRAYASDSTNPQLTQALTQLTMSEQRDAASANKQPMPVRPQSATSNAPLPPGRIRVSGAVQQSKLIESPTPEYPALAQQARIQGVVRLNIVIAHDGAITNLVLQSGHPLLVPAATEAVRRYRYAPTTLNGQPVEVETVVDVNFTL